ncbi:MAG: hypothetical protein ACE5L7_02970 [Candidatus Aminicenantales bacterium]
MREKKEKKEKGRGRKESGRKEEEENSHRTFSLMIGVMFLEQSMI